jgi:hypothetical protein
MHELSFQLIFTIVAGAMARSIIFIYTENDSYPADRKDYLHSTLSPGKMRI